MDTVTVSIGSIVYIWTVKKQVYIFDKISDVKVKFYNVAMAWIRGTPVYLRYSAG